MLTCAIALTVGLIVAAPVGAQESPAADLARAQEALEAGELATAEQLFRAVITADPWAEDAYRGLAESLLGQGRGRQSVLVICQLAQRLINTGRQQEARELLERALEVDAQVSVAHALHGVALLGLGEHGDAAAALQRALDLGERSPQTRLMLAGAQWEMGDLAAAEATYRAAVEATGGDPTSLHQLGSLLLWQGRYEEAIAPLERSLSRTSPTCDLLYDLGRALDGAGQLDRARDTLRRAVNLDPSHAQARYAYARILAQGGATGEARIQMEEWQRLYHAEQEQLYESKLEAARVERGWTLLRSGDAQAAVDQFESLTPSAESLFGLGSALAALGRNVDAVAALERALALAPDRRDVRRQLALARLAVEERG